MNKTCIERLMRNSDLENFCKELQVSRFKNEKFSFSVSDVRVLIEYYPIYLISCNHKEDPINIVVNGITGNAYSDTNEMLVGVKKFANAARDGIKLIDLIAIWLLPFLTLFCYCFFFNDTC